MKTQTIIMFFIAVQLAGMNLQGASPTVSAAEAALLKEINARAEEEPAAALELLLPQLEGHSHSAALDYTAGLISSRLSRNPEAISFFRQALQKAPQFDPARTALAYALATESRWQEAESILLPLTRREDAARDTLLLYAHILLESGRTIAAENTYRRLLQEEGETPATLQGLARCFIMQQRAGESIAILEALIRLSPDDSIAWALVADARLARNEPLKALASLEAARRLNSVTPAMLLQLGDLYLMQSLPEAAVAAYRQAAATGTESASWILRAAEGMLQAGEAEEAATWLQRYADGTAELPEGYFRLNARLAISLNDVATAKAACTEWLQHDPLNLEALLSLGDLEKQDGNSARASIWYERARDLHVNDAAPLLRLADLLAAGHKYRQAAEVLEQASWLDNRPEIRQAIAQLRRLSEMVAEGASQKKETNNENR